MTYLALYREWRPRTFSEIIGQEHVTRTLRNAMVAGRVSHAYLFCGARGTGKTTTAKVLARAVNCLRREGPEPCNDCANCLTITDGTSVDVIEIDAASNRGIDEIRDLREKVKFAPGTGRYRVYIIDEVHMLTSEAFNALLKTLEEPPGHAVFILATTEPHKVPLTILSRCQRFDFRRIAPAGMIGRLREVAGGARLEVEEDALMLVARAAEGGLRDALSILDQLAAMGQSRITPEDVHNLLGTVRGDALEHMAGCLAAGEAGKALRLLAALKEEGKDLRLFARELAAYLRALLLEKISPGAAAGETWAGNETMAGSAAKFSEGQLVSLVEIITAAEQEMKWSSLPDIILEVALVKACRQRGGAAAGPADPADQAGVAELAERLAALERRLDQMTSVREPVTIPASTAIRPARRDREKAVPAGPGSPDKEPAGRISGEGAGVTAGEGTALTIDRAREAWPDILDAIKKERLPLFANLTRTVPLSVEGRRLTVGFSQDGVLAKELAELPQNRKYLEELVARFCNQELKVAYEFYQGEIELPGKRKAPAQPVEDVRKRFDGKEISLEEQDDTLF